MIYLTKTPSYNVSNFFKKNSKVQWISGINGYIKKNFRFSGIPYVYPRFILRRGYAHSRIMGISYNRKVFLLGRAYIKRLVVSITSITTPVIMDCGSVFQKSHFFKLFFLRLVFLDLGMVRTPK